MKHHSYKNFLGTDLQNQETVLNWLLAGLLGLMLAAVINLLMGFVLLGETYQPARLVAAVCPIGFFGCLLALAYCRQRLLPSLMMAAILFTAGVTVLYRWDISNPYCRLLFSVAVVMAGILLTARLALYILPLTSLIISVLVYGDAHQYWDIDLGWMQVPPRLADVASVVVILGILVLVAWLLNRQMEVALSRAKRSEKALKRQRDRLELKVEQRTRELQAAQLDQIKQFYRFAELGHLSTALFHDMANHLASVSVDIQGLPADPHSAIAKRIQQNIAYINEVVQRVRRQIQGQSEVERFNVVEEVEAIIKMLAYHSRHANVLIKLRPSRPLIFNGDLTRFRQIIVNLLTNGLEAYPAGKQIGPDQPLVEVAIGRTKRNLKISVTDHGKGISAARRSKIFEPFYTTKDKGMGIGLFIVRQMVEKDFGGSISLTGTSAGTTFIVKLPLKRRPANLKGSRQGCP